MKTLTFIPFLDRIDDLTRPVMLHLLNDNTGLDDLLMASNGPVTKETLDFQHEAEALSDRVRVVHWQGWNFYKMWNEALDRAMDYDACILLNNDVTLSEHCITKLGSALLWEKDAGIVAPFYDGGCCPKDEGHHVRVHGTYRNCGWWGAAFAVCPQRLHDYGVPRIDERFRWWGGDDDFAEQIKLSGLAEMLITGTHFVHLGGGTQTGNTLDWVQEAQQEDKALYKHKYGAAW